MTIDDYEDMIELWKKSGLPFKSKGRDSKRAVARHMETDSDLFQGAFIDDTLVGVVIGSYDRRGKGWINRLAVNPEWQRQGVGQRLIAGMEKILKEKGATVICALIEERNHQSMVIFKKMGYVFEKSILYFSKRESEDA